VPTRIGTTRIVPTRIGTTQIGTRRWAGQRARAGEGKDDESSISWIVKRWTLSGRRAQRDGAAHRLLGYVSKAVGEGGLRAQLTPSGVGGWAAHAVIEIGRQKVHRGFFYVQVKVHIRDQETNMM
jgi:hypothetical protein